MITTTHKISAAREPIGIAEKKKQLQYIFQYMQVIDSTWFFLEVHSFASQLLTHLVITWKKDITGRLMQTHIVFQLLFIARTQYY